MIIEHRSSARRNTFSLHSDIPGGGTFVTISGELVVGNRQELKELIETHARERHEEHGSAGRYVVDLKETGYIDSSGLGVLFALQEKRLPRYDGWIELINVNEDLTMLFELTRLDVHFSINGRPRRSEAPALSVVK